MALKNAILNVASGRCPEFDIQAMFVRFIEDLTPTHLLLLQFFQNPREFGKRRGISFPSWSAGAPSHVLEAALPEVAKAEEICNQIIRDLSSSGLVSINANSLNTMMTESGMFAKRTTPMGDQFLQFISSETE